MRLDRRWWRTRLRNMRVLLVAIAVWLAGGLLALAHPELKVAAAVVVTAAMLVAATWYFRRVVVRAKG